MRIQKIESQSRRDFTAVYECEHCHATKRGYGYDDGHFHNNIIPMMTCDACGKSGGDNYKPRDTKYPDGMVI